MTNIVYLISIFLLLEDFTFLSKAACQYNTSHTGSNAKIFSYPHRNGKYNIKMSSALRKMWPRRLWPWIRWLHACHFLVRPPVVKIGETVPKNLFDSRFICDEQHYPRDTYHIPTFFQKILYNILFKHPLYPVICYISNIVTFLNSPSKSKASLCHIICA